MDSVNLRIQRLSIDCEAMVHNVESHVSRDAAKAENLERLLLLLLLIGILILLNFHSSTNVLQRLLVVIELL